MAVCPKDRSLECDAITLVERLDVTQLDRGPMRSKFPFKYATSAAPLVPIRPYVARTETGARNEPRFTYPRFYRPGHSARSIGEVISTVGRFTTTSQSGFLRRSRRNSLVAKNWACVLRNHTNV